MSEKEKDAAPIVAYHKKMNALFEDVLAMDWEPDKEYSIKAGMPKIKYVTISKMKRQLAPAVQKRGLNFDVSFTDVTISGEYLTLYANLRFTDVDTGYGEITHSVGGARAGEKAIQIASSFALKTGIFNKFLIADGIEPEDSDDKVPRGNGFVKKSADDVAEIKSKIQENAIEPPKKEELVDVDDKKLVEAKGIDDAVLGYIPTSYEVKAIDNIMGKWKDKLDAKEIDTNKFKEVCDAKLAINSKGDLVAFVRKYKVM